MAIHPICDDPGATDDWWSPEGYLRSVEVALTFSPTTRGRIEIETRKWCQTTWLVKPLRKICILTYSSHGLSLTWPWPDLAWGQILKLTFQGKKANVSNRLDESNTMLSFLFSCLSYKKAINEKPYPWKTINFHLMTSGARPVDLRSNLNGKLY